MSRRRAREAALQALFQLDLNHGTEDERELYESLAVDMALQESKSLSDRNRQYVFEAVRGVRENLAEIDKRIAAHARAWKLSRMAVVDRNIMRLAAYEMGFQEIDPGIAINEAVELAKKYGTEDSGRFVNGILNALAKGVC